MKSLRKETGVGDFTGTKNVELMDPISPAKLVSTVDDQLPSLLSMVIDGLPPLQPSKYVHEAEKRLQQYVERHQDARSLDYYCRLGLASVSYLHPGVTSEDCFVTIAIIYAFTFLLDDFFFDSPDEFCQDLYGQYGISCDARESPPKIQEYLKHLDAVFSQQVQPRNPAPLIETLMWELGRDMLELSNPEWFRSFVAGIVECHHTSVTSHVDIIQGHNLCFQDLESYTSMRVGNAGGAFAQMLMEFANNSYIPSILKETPYFNNVTTATSIYIGFLNDVFSYHKESLIEQNPHNLITVLMECEGKPFVQTVHRAIGLVNTYTRTIIDLEAEASNSTLQNQVNTCAHAIMDLEAEAWNSTLRNHLLSTKVLIAGHVYVHFFNKRYRHPDSVFPELRDMTSRGLGLVGAVNVSPFKYLDHFVVLVVLPFGH